MEPVTTDQGVDVPYVQRDGITYGTLSKGESRLPPGCVEVHWKCSPPPHVDAAAVKGYFQKLLVGRGLAGHFHIWAINEWPKGNPNILSYKFTRGNECPLHGKSCDYGFDYKIKAGHYGGWKCWKTGDWESQFVMPEVFTYGPL